MARVFARQLVAEQRQEATMPGKEPTRRLTAFENRMGGKCSGLLSVYFTFGLLWANILFRANQILHKTCSAVLFAVWLT